MREQVSYGTPCPHLLALDYRAHSFRHALRLKSTAVTANHFSWCDVSAIDFWGERRGIDHRADEVEAVVEALDAARTFHEEREQQPLLAIALRLGRRRALIE